VVGEAGTADGSSVATDPLAVGLAGCAVGDGRTVGLGRGVWVAGAVGKGVGVLVSGRAARLQATTSAMTAITRMTTTDKIRFIDYPVLSSTVL
jgi:hypothetical protein